MSTILKTEHLTKRFGKKIAVNDVSMTIERGDIYGFIGKNGAGKTTLMRLVLNLAFPTSGKVELFGQKTFSRKNLGRVGSLVEAPTLFGNCTAWENMKRFSVLYGADDNEIREILRMVSLSETGRKKVKKFSFGMKQRLGIAIALLGDPEFIILDEPVNGLDPEGIREMRDLILRLNHEKGTTFLISSHLLDELSKIVTKYGILRDGVLVEEISAEEVSRKCARKIKIDVDDPDGAKTAITDAFAQAQTAIENRALFVTTQEDLGAQINKLLLEKGFSVRAVEVIPSDIEGYFISLMGGVHE